MSGEFGGNPGTGKSYMIGPDPDNLVKLDIYYSMDPFFREVIIGEGVRMAGIAEIVAMKVDVVQRVGRKKDFWDLHELLTTYTIAQMIALHQERFEWTHDEQLIRNNFVLFKEADEEPDPVCLKNKQWIFIMEDFELALTGGDAIK